MNQSAQAAVMMFHHHMIHTPLAPFQAQQGQAAKVPLKKQDPPPDAEEEEEPNGESDKDNDKEEDDG